MAAGTAAALVPIRSIERRVAPDSTGSISAAVKKHPRLSIDDDAERVTYIEDSQEDAGPICLKLLSQLKGIQLGKVDDEFGWNVKVTEQDGTSIEGRPQATNGNGQTIDQMD
jgi:branched-chain amino acid aminotransferase